MSHQNDHGPQRELPPGMAEQLDLPYSGLATFGHRPFLTEVEQLDSWQPDVAIVGAPFDVGTTNRPGARFGPRAIRATAPKIHNQRGITSPLAQTANPSRKTPV